MTGFWKHGNKEGHGKEAFTYENTVFTCNCQSDSNYSLLSRAKC